MPHFSEEIFKSAAGHGFFQGTTSFISGGEFWSGFAAGSLSSLAASAWSGGTSVDANGNSIAGTGMAGLGGDFASSTAGMVAFGTVMGGASAELSGGNFWQGAATGLMVSLLNHTMHKIQNRNNLIVRLKDAGYNPNDFAALSDSELAGFAQQVLPELYAEAHSPLFESRENLTDGKGNSVNGLTVGGEFYKDKPRGFISKIQLAKSIFSSYLKLASTMGHELNHAADYVNGNMTRWYNKGGHGYRNAMSEAKAYNWQFNMSGAPVNLEAYSSYNNQVNLWNKLFNGFK